MPQVLEFKFKNVCTYGNKWQQIPFDSKPKLVLIVGQNGAGKTTISNAFEYSWYGQTRKRKLKELANRLNGHLETYNKFMSDAGNVVEVHRGISPDFLEMKIDNIPYDKAGKAKANKYIEEELIGIPFDVFTNTIILSINDFKSFVRISAEDKRKIIDRVFGTDVFNVMNNFLKNDLKMEREELQRANDAHAQQTFVVRQTEATLDELKKNMSEERERELAAMEDKLTAECSRLETLNAEWIVSVNKCESLTTQFDTDVSGFNTALFTNDTALLCKIQDAESRWQAELDKKIAVIESSIKSDTDAYIVKYENSKSEYESSIKSVRNAAQTILDKEIETRVAERDASLADMQQKYTVKSAELNKTYDDNKAECESKYSNDRAVLDTKITDLNSAVGILTETSTNTVIAITKLNGLIEQANAKIKLYDSGVCPECDTDLKTPDHAHKKRQYELHVAEHAKKILEYDISKNSALLSINEKHEEIKAKLKERDELGKKQANKLQAIFQEKSNKLSSFNDAYSNTTGNITLKCTEDIAAKRIEFEQKIALELAGLNKKLTTLNEEKAQRLELFNNDRHIRVNDATDQINAELLKETQVYGNDRILIAKKCEADVAAVTAIYNKAFAESTDAKTRGEINASNLRADVMTLDAQLTQLKLGAPDSKQVLSMETLLAGLNDSVAALNAQIAEYEEKIRVFLATQEMLTEDGLKKVFMGAMIPAMNQEIQQMITAFEYKFDFHFTESFEAVISHMGQEVSVDSLSTGEEKMIDIIVLMSVMKLIKLKHPKMSMMFLDEIFASLDGANIDKAVNILKDFMRAYEMTIFVISHTMVPLVHFDTVIEVKPDGYFSDLVIK